MLYRVITWLLLPFFALKLGLVALPTILKVAYPEKLHLIPLLPALLFLLVIVNQLALIESKTQLEENPSQATIVRDVFQPEIEFWTGWYQVQPTHRDILLNLALLYRQVGDEQKALYYLEQARQIDPNSPEVKDPSWN